MKIIHIITGLNDGGAEAVLFRLCSCDITSQHVVVSLSSHGKYGPLLEKRGISTLYLNMQPGQPSLLAFFKLVFFLMFHKPDIVQTWMYHADLFGSLAARLASIKVIIWGIRQTTLEVGKSKIITIWITKLLAKLSWWLPTLIITCAQSAITIHEQLGYTKKKMRFIPNGYEFNDFIMNSKIEKNLRSSLGLDSDIPLIGMVARFDPQKDHNNFFRALSLICNKGIAFKCLLVGSKVDSANITINTLISQLGLQDKVLLLGIRSDIPAIMSMLDLHILSSAYGEAFPNVVAEAMVCGTPCVATDVGDAAFIIGDTGWVVPPANPQALADAIEYALTEYKTLAWNLRCSAARNRIIQNFSIERMVANYHQIWKEAITKCAQ